jgi:hypothetical protein
MCAVARISDPSAVETKPFLDNARRLLGPAWLLIGIGALWIALKARIDSDGLVRYQDLVLMMSGHSPAGKFSVIQALLSVPLYILGERAGGAEGAVSHFNFFVLVALLIAVWRMIPRHGLRVALLLLAASMLPAYAGLYFGELLTALCVVLGFWTVQKNWILSAALIGIGVANTPATLPAAGLAALYYYFSSKRTSVAAGTILAGVLMVLENRWKFHAFFVTPYLSGAERGVKTDIMPYSGLPGFSYPIVFGVLAILFSFGKGLLFFMPSLPLAIKKFRPSMPTDVSRFVNGLLFFVAGLIVVYSQWWAWYGGAAWGPRLLIIASVPAIVLLAFALDRAPKLIIVFVLLASGWVCVEGVLYGLGNVGKCMANNYALESLCWYVPEYSPLFNGFVMGFPAVGRGKIIYAAWCLLTLVGMAVVALWGRPKVWYAQAVTFGRSWRWRSAEAADTAGDIDDAGGHVPASPAEPADSPPAAAD